MKKLTAIFVTIILCISLCSCSENKVSDISDVTTETTIASETTTHQQEAIVEEIKSKEKVEDYYDYALKDWLSGLEFSQDDLCLQYSDKYEDLIFDNLCKLIVDKSPEDYEDNSALQKLVKFYNQLCDDNTTDATIEHIKAMYSRVEKVKSVDDYLEMLKDSDYVSFDRIFSKDYLYDDNNYFILFKLEPYGGYKNLSKEKEEFLTKEISKQFTLLGISQKEADLKAQSAMQLNKEIISFATKDSDITYWDEEAYAQSEHTIPLTDLLKNYGYFKYNIYQKESYEYLTNDTALYFYDNHVTDERINDIKNLYEANLMNYLFSYGSLNMRESVLRISSVMQGFPLERIDEVTFIKDDNDLKENNIALIIGADNGHFVKLYKDTYITVDVIDEINAMVDDIKKSFVEIINSSDWLSDRVREKLVIKIKTMTINMGENSAYSTYEDVQIGQDAVDTILSINKSNKEFNKRFLTCNKGLAKEYLNMYTVNGQYNNDSNSVLLTLGSIHTLMDIKDASYEEKLGYFGEILSHEIAHALGLSYITNGVDGVYMDYFGNEEINVLYSSYEKIAAMINPYKTSNGNSFNGRNCANELLTDILSMNSCIRILNKMENADFDAFFKGYAKALGCEMVPSYEKWIIEEDYHVIGRYRVDIVFYQFDEFYDTYDIDENNKLYISPENRITGYIY